MKRLALAAVVAFVLLAEAFDAGLVKPFWDFPIVNPAHAQVPSTISALTASSGNVAAATATASLAAQGGQMNYVCGFAITGGGATGASIIQPTLTGLNGGTMTFSMGIVAGVTLNQTPLNILIFPCQPATALNTAITLSVPSFGAGNTNATASVWGYRLPY